MAANPVETSVYFRITKYARLGRPSTALTIQGFSQTEGEQGTQTAAGNEQWIYYNSEIEDMRLCISETSMFTLRRGNIIIENFSLLLAKDSMRVTAKGNSILMNCKTREQNRKFRLQFAPENEKTSVERCAQCVKMLASYINVKTTSSQGNCPRTLTGETGLDGIIKALLDPTKWQMLGTYDVDLDSPQLQEAVTFCLLDPNFPSFVTNVEKFLKSLMADVEKDKPTEINESFLIS